MHVAVQEAVKGLFGCLVNAAAGNTALLCSVASACKHSTHKRIEIVSQATAVESLCKYDLAFVDRFVLLLRQIC